MNLVHKAKIYAEKHFEGITEKNPEKTPYINHLQRVAELVELSGGSDIEVAAAWLHDIVEDTPVTIAQVQKEFGQGVTLIVEGLTDKAEYSQLTVQEKKQRQAARLISETDSAKRVKLADQISAVEIDTRNSLLSIDHRLMYVQGAKKIADICLGISELLDNEFKKAHLEASKRLELESLANTVTEFIEFFNQDKDHGQLVYPEWTAKDILGHITFWHESFARNLRDVAEGRTAKPLRGSLTDVNVTSVESTRSVSIEDLCQRLRDAQQIIARYILDGNIEKIPYKVGSRDYAPLEHLEVVISHIQKHLQDVSKKYK